MSMSGDYRPTSSASQYISCPHISVKTIAAAKIRIACLKAQNVGVTSSTHVCLICSQYGAFTPGSEFRHHFSTFNHRFCLRVGSPSEIYCLQCGDYQFCSLLDSMVGRKRPFVEAARPFRIERTESFSFVPRSTSSLPRGLANMGSTCFMSSALQMLCCYKPLVFSKHLSRHARICGASSRRSVGSTDHESECERGKCIPCEFKAVADALWVNDATEANPVIPSDLLFALWTTVDYMAGYSQQDAHEFLIAFLNCMEMQLGSAENADVEPHEMFHRFYSGSVQSSLKCSACGYSSVKNEQFVDLNLSLDDSAFPQSTSSDLTDGSVSSSNDEAAAVVDQEMSLHDCLKYFTISEQLSQKMHCPKCAESQFFQKQLSIFTPPELLILHLKRFDYMHQKKICSPVRFPLEGLDIGPCMTSVLDADASAADHAADGSCDKDSLYDLQGVVCHSGSMNQGHYIAYIRGGGDQQRVSYWIRCDDERICVVSSSEVEMAEGYLLFYAKRKQQQVEQQEQQPDEEQCHTGNDS